MSIETVSSNEWQVPAYIKDVWAARSGPWCVVIPVINEGDRIKRLLERMNVAGVHTLADIIIVDGGSTDGSLVPAQLQQLGVAALLVKTGVGRLSAQLRCAYAFAMNSGYEGVITIDGNDKDDPAAIPSFIAALEQGVDFIQGSRFIAGGEAINTPLVRHVAIRLLHAPLLALFSGYKWTDTTQGFRGYSRKMLLDPRVAPFREIFTEYELLAYLSYRAPRLGFDCLELPSTRRYPPGKPPTKISFVRGNVKVFKTLIKACLGQYNPSGPHDQ
ncbi:MAG: glycosyl transferase family 2 [Pseudomonas sp.]|jgi:glycosyltransferase involved in cell wall biosynthesis|nr:glycosyl transferase family 2 [Pseudomonadales bacterium]MAK87862.1 glycosyl transferase family 2 [Pseudomonas sp.]HCH77359.1 glycosyl transferase family 2 [Pseudomonas sp.]|tara:strand:+ start:230 stop:1048 length:819 start_codon:yes stop_codon:yes gene_type:complete